MKSLRLMPLTFLAGLHGFVVFAPYLVLVLVVMHASRWFGKVQA